jgi:Zn-dependent M16 (insulinase) family peptidase
MRKEPFLDVPKARYGDFVLTKIIPIAELKSTLRELVHEPTGASVIHLECDDPENLFCLSFKTLPFSANGVAHILEHTVLCGSRKFPVKDPFFSMNRRSLNTFMNALTGSDFTCYPAATQVEKDFYNLLEVYIDAVFHPQLKEVSFLQEGHRLEFSEPANPKSPLEYKGIVYNEMKGSLASGDSRLWHAMLAALFPDLPYGFNSGGEPKEIPELSYEELIAFHETYYHPSRCLFFFYGNFPLKKHLDFIAEHALKHVPKVPPLRHLPLQPRFPKPRTFEERFPINEGEELENKAMIAFGWITAPLIEQDEVLALSVLDSILMDTDASPLKILILKSGLCVHADSYIDTDMSEVPYLIVCKGCEKESAEALEKTLFDSLKKIVKQGIPKHLIDTAIHQLEFSRTEIAGDSSPFGLTLFMRSALAKQHGCPPENALTLHALFEKLITNTKNPDYFPSLIQKYFLNNTHFVRLSMIPDPDLATQENAEERKKLDAIQKNLTKEQIETILQNTKSLSQYQKETEHQNLDILPKVGLTDVPVLVHDFPLHQHKFGDLQVFHHECFTNQILYADIILDLPELQEEDLPYLQLLVSILPEIGAGKRDWAANLEFTQTHTGGVGAATSLHVQLDAPSTMKPSFVLRGKALYRKVDKLFLLMKDMLTKPSFDDRDRIKELILQIDTSLQNRFNRSALKYALQLALSGFSTPSHLSNLMQGLPYYKQVQQIAKMSSKNIDAIIEKFLDLKERIFSQKAPHLVLSCDEKMYHELSQKNFFDLDKLPSSEKPAWKNSFTPTPVSSQARVISSPVAFTVEAFQSIHYIHPHAPAMSCVMPLFENKILHRKVREEGGAYGSGAAFSSTFGNFYFHSYRDPNIAQTLSTFHEAIEELHSGKFTEADLEEAKLGVIQSMDLPVAPGSRAHVAYSWWRDGRTKEMRQHYRNRLLALTKHDVIQALEKEILPKKDQGVVVTFAGREQLEKENALLGPKALPILAL